MGSYRQGGPQVILLDHYSRPGAENNRMRLRVGWLVGLGKVHLLPAQDSICREMCCS